MIILTSNKMKNICSRCDKSLNEDENDIHTCTPKRDFKFSAIEEAMQPIPTPKVQPQLTDDEALFADAFITLQKAGYSKEAEIVLKCKPAWQGLTKIETGTIRVRAGTYQMAIQMTEAKLKEKNG